MTKIFQKWPKLFTDLYLFNNQSGNDFRALAQLVAGGWVERARCPGLANTPEVVACCLG